MDKTQEDAVKEVSAFCSVLVLARKLPAHKNPRISSKRGNSRPIKSLNGANEMLRAFRMQYEEIKRVLMGCRTPNWNAWSTAEIVDVVNDRVDKTKQVAKQCCHLSA